MKRKQPKHGLEAWLDDHFRGRDLATLTEIDAVPSHLTGTLDKALGNCRSLTTLNLSNMRSLSGTLLVVGSCKGLTSLNLFNCDKLTGTLDALDSCLQLTNLK
jgi:hypothetical protein